MCYRIYSKKTFLALSTCILLVLTTSCGKSEQPNAQQESVQQQQSQEKEPEKLKNIEARLETLIDTLGGPSIKMEEGKSGQQGSQQGSQQGNKQQDTKQQQGSQQGSQQGTKQQDTNQQKGSQQGSQQGTKQQDTKQQQGTQEGTQQKKGGQQLSLQQEQKDEAKWKEVGTLISNLHYQWNEFMPEISKKGADMKLINNFDDALNNLTNTVLTKDTEKTLTSANALYSFIPDIYSLFKVKMSPEVKRMIYYTRNIILEASKDNWDQVKKDNDSLSESWSFFKNTLEKEQELIGAKLDFSIYELGKVTEAKDKHLTNIKGRIVLSNIQEIEKSFEEK